MSGSEGPRSGPRIPNVPREEWTDATREVFMRFAIAHDVAAHRSPALMQQAAGVDQGVEALLLAQPSHC